VSDRVDIKNNNG